ncbi:MAG: hypothetical protein ABIS21_06360, partial [Acidimicrobiales bacterium]
SLYDSPAFPEEGRYRSAVEQAWPLVAPVVRGTRAESLAFEAEDDVAWPTMAGLAVRLERRGVHVAVPDSLVSIFGERHRRTGSEDLRVLFLDPAIPPPGSASLLGLAGAYALYALAS